MSLIGGHRSVLSGEIVETLAIRPDDVFLDGTLGGAGHAKLIAQMLGTKGIFIGIDADHDAILRAEEALTEAVAKVVLIEGNFRDVESHLGKHGIQHITKALFDLGWSGFQLTAGRGFSFLQDEPLLMTYTDSPTAETLTAEKIVNTWKAESIADVIYGWGEERYSRQIARGIEEARKKSPIKTSLQLADIIRGSVPSFYRSGRIHPATKTFQALRIAVNDEMGALKQGLSDAFKMLAHGGRLAVITFHSVEDREVKRMMLEWAKNGSAERITKSPLKPSEAEVRANPRSRSAKLRVVAKLPDSEMK
ncbi:MAG: 16S rRNA (cytosine(1402)-N(4))-methyltransferase RsmH [Minisyncoccia bacterium]